MTILGITGPTGAGKTTLLREVEKLGGEVIDCDAVYHEMLKSDIPLQDSLEKEFGPLWDEAGGIDRKKLGAIVFRNPDRLERLNSIAWSLVTDRVREILGRYREQGRALAAIDAIALLESPLNMLCQLRIAVLAPPDIRVKRVMAREGISEEYAWARVKAQKPDEYFIQNCDHTLLNNYSSAEEFVYAAQELLKEVLS